MAALLLAAGLTAGCHSAAAPVLVEPTIAPTTTPARPPRSPVPPRITYPAHGSERWVIAPAGTKTAGTGGRLRRYRVAVERDIKGVTPAGFAAAAGATLADPRGWTGGGQWRFRRVGPGQEYDFTLYLATPGTRGRLCADITDEYTSCRNGAKVVLNVERWARGVPFYPRSLGAYRQYMVNHEVGHRLGHGHEKCPGRGELAPVMQQQTLGLHGCRPDPWPYPDGTYHSGPSGAYDDQIPSALNR